MTVLMEFILRIVLGAFILCVALETLSHGWSIYFVCRARELFTMLGTSIFFRTWQNIYFYIFQQDIYFIYHI